MKKLKAVLYISLYLLLAVVYAPIAIGLDGLSRITQSNVEADIIKMWDRANKK